MRDAIYTHKIRRQDSTEITATPHGYIVVEQFGDVGEDSRVVEISTNSAREFLDAFAAAYEEAKKAQAGSNGGKP